MNAQDLGSRIGSLSEGWSRAIARSLRFQPTAFCQASQETIKDLLHRFHDPERVAGELLSSGYRRHFPDASRQLSGCQLITGEYRLLDGRLASGRNHLIMCRLGGIS